MIAFKLIMKKISGIPASGGLAIGKALLWTGNDFPEIPRYIIHKAQVDDEWKRFLVANKNLVEKIKQHIDSLENEKNKEQSDLLRAHLMMLEDLDFQRQIRAALESQLENIEWIVWSISHEMAQKLLSAPDAYLRERASDISDMSHEILNKLLSIQQLSLSDISEDCIVIARDIPPSQALTMNKTHIKAIVTDYGSRISHTAILARSLEIPAVLGVSNGTLEINNGDMLVVDGDFGTIAINPDADELERSNGRVLSLQKKISSQQSLRDLPPETKDGKRFILKANIEVPSDAERIMQYGAEGIGLFRSEFLFLSNGEVTEEERQYKAYSDVIKTLGNMPVTIRTVDVGGDKVLPNFFPKEEKNPLLGWRAIRFSLAMPELFRAQLRAILRAASKGNLRIMFPLISGIEELDQAIAALEEAKAECRKVGQPVAENIQIGVMIEVPSAAVTADILAKKADFLSIGTNDLMQYTLAVDRGNQKVSYLAQNIHPAIIRLLKMTIDASHKAGKSVSMCGEMAGDTLALPLLLGLGLDEFSVSAPAIPEVKSVIRQCDYQKCKKLAEKILECENISEIKKILNEAK
ncbi:phosphoenolpyruvate-protein phosphotransferase [Spirochaetia bacterium]|nr:phosphoenolpyruvate-protein phosphotransferase [Spirochaetia bacterium]